MALIKIFDGNYQPNITRLDYSQKIPYKIIDIERSNVSMIDRSPSKIRTTIAITVDNPQSTSNLLLVQNLTIDIEGAYIDYNIL